MLSSRHVLLVCIIITFLAIASLARTRTVDYLYAVEDVPIYLRDAFIQSGYRKDLSIQQCLVSIFQLHNETVNIWTHGLAAVWFWKRFVLAPVMRHSQKPIKLYCACFGAVFTASFLAHTFSAFPSKNLYEFLWRLDWSMISVAMFGTFQLLVHAIFSNDARLRLIWKILFGVSTATMFAAVNMPGFVSQSPGLKLFGALIPIPCLIGFLLHSYCKLPQALVIRFLQDLLGPIVLSLVGLGIYGSQVPERWYPNGFFDYFGMSHNLHHGWTILFSVWILGHSQKWFRGKPDKNLPLVMSA